MTQKELLYLEDAIGHEKNIITIIEDTISRLDDENLVSFMQNELTNHTNMKEKLMNFLEDKANE